MSTIKILIIDDEPLARSIVREYLGSYPQFEIADECGNGFEGLQAIIRHKPDLIFLDIQMPKLTGFEMLELADDKPAVIFTTAYDEYALRAFEAHATDYLMKPFSKERFDKAIIKWLGSKQTDQQALNTLLESENHPEERTRIAVRNDSQIHIIPVNDVYYIEAFDDYVKIFTKDTYFLKKKTLGHFEQVLPEDAFLRVHRSFLLRLDAITKIEPYEKTSHIALLRNGRKVPLSRQGYARLKEKLGV